MAVDSASLATIAPVAEPLSAAKLEAIATGLAAALAVTPPEPATDGRRWWRLLATDRYDAWLIDWPIDTAVEPHDHGGSAGAFAVVTGELTELTFTPAGTTATTVPASGSRQIDVATIHDIVNAGDRPATSVHVYSPPLASMSFYDDAAGSPCRIERVDDERPVWSVEPFAATMPV